MNWYKQAQQDYIQDMMQRWEHQGVKLYIYEQDNRIVLDNIIVPKEKRKQGIGTQIMQELTGYADQVGKRVELTPAVKDDFHGTTSRRRLVDWYKRQGFIENKGRKKDYTTNKGMYREPRNELV